MLHTKSVSDLIQEMVAESIQVKSRFFAENAGGLCEAARVIAHGFQSGKKVLLFGNGGSAADAQHIATELVGRFMADREPLPALSLSADTCALTALGNDYGFENIFARQIAALGCAGDTAVAISTSGASANVLNGVAVARQKGLYTVGLTGDSGGKMIDAVEVLFRVPSSHTPRIQETHIMIGHVLCELIERFLIPANHSRA